LVKHISKWPAETQEAKDIAMVLQHARAINRIDVLVWHNVSNNITNNPPQAQAQAQAHDVDVDVDVDEGVGVDVDVDVGVGVGVGVVLDV
jgi:hypothetical protein